MPTTKLKNDLTVTGDIDVLGRLRVRGNDIPADNLVVVQTADDLAGELDSTKQYLIDGVVDMGTQSITVPEGGLSLRGLGTNISCLTSSADNYTMFVGADGTYAGSLLVEYTQICVSGTNSTLINLDNAGNLGFVNFRLVGLRDCTSLGTLDSYLLVGIEGVSIIDCVDGFTMEGTWLSGGYIITTAILNTGAPTFTGTVFKKGTSTLIYGSMRSDMNALLIADTGTISDFAPANMVTDGQFRMEGVRVNPNINAFPNMPFSDPKASFRECTGLENTHPGGISEITTQGVTSGLTIDTLVILPGLATGSYMEWFSLSGNNAIIYDSAVPLDAEVTAILSFSGSNGREVGVQIRHWRNATSDYHDIGPVFKATLNGGPGGTRAENVTCGAYAELDENDRIEIWIKNITDTTNITVLTGSQIRVKQR